MIPYWPHLVIAVYPDHEIAGTVGFHTLVQKSDARHLVRVCETTANGFATVY